MFSGPSGAGKTSLVAKVLARRPDLQLSVSATTRSPRPGEENGVQYRFLSEAEFDGLLEQDGFIEWAHVHGARYGTPRDGVQAAIAAGRSVILEIDVQGARQVLAAYPDVVSIFVAPPSAAVLEARLKGRATESDEAMAVRLANATEELAAAAEFGHRVVNDDLDEATSEVIRILDGLGI